MSDRWMELVRYQETGRAMHERQVALSSFGQSLDSGLWSILDRFWALGLPTQGSCTGHHVTNFTFVTLNARSRWDVATTARWRRLVDEWLAPAVTPGVLFTVSGTGFETQYPGATSEAEYAAVYTRALQWWCDKLDRAGRDCALHHPAWEAWDGPALDVPSTVDANHLLTPFIRYLGTLDPTSEMVVRQHLTLITATWETLATQLQEPVDSVIHRWESAWDGWVAQFSP